MGINAGIDMNMVPYDALRFTTVMKKAVENGDIPPERIDDAVNHYQEALRLKPDYTDSLNGLAILFAQAGRFDDARVQWEKALVIDPNYRVARENLRRLEQMPVPSR